MYNAQSSVEHEGILRNLVKLAVHHHYVMAMTLCLTHLKGGCWQRGFSFVFKRKQFSDSIYREKSAHWPCVFFFFKLTIKIRSCLLQPSNDVVGKNNFMCLPWRSTRQCHGLTQAVCTSFLCKADCQRLYAQFFDYEMPGLYDGFVWYRESRMIEVPLYIPGSFRFWLNNVYSNLFFYTHFFHSDKSPFTYQCCSPKTSLF